MRTFVIGDIHGSYQALVQCLQRSGFDHDRDRLVILGDVCDRKIWVRQSIDELLKIRHRDLITGNHDQWALDWAVKGEAPPLWTSQGGAETLASYDGGPMPQEHIDFLKSGRLWIERDGQFFVHAGFDPAIPFEQNTEATFIWSRSLLDEAWKMHHAGKSKAFGGYKDIFVGHTTTQFFRTLEPLHVCNVWGMDTGAGGSGKLTIMDVTTKEYWQSDLASELYEGRT